MKNLLLTAALVLGVFVSCQQAGQEPIDRKALVDRNKVQVNAFDSLASLSLGNGNFAFTVDITGLQTFPERYSKGVPLGTQSQWGWHSFPNTQKYRFEETLRAYNFRGKEELYAVQFNEKGRPQAAADYFRINPHRLHLGVVGLELRNPQGEIMRPEDLSEINQELDLWNGTINSLFKAGEFSVHTQSYCHPEMDMMASSIESSMFLSGNLRLRLAFPYPSGNHSDDACDWSSPGKHSTKVLAQKPGAVLLERRLDNDSYYVLLCWKEQAEFISGPAAHHFYLQPAGEKLSFTCLFLERNPLLDSSELPACPESEQVAQASSDYWNQFWLSGGAVDFSACTDPRAPELERRVVLSQYLMAIQCAGVYPPQESGLTYNTWYGKFHLEMHWWHGVHFVLWGRPELLERSLDWYRTAEANAANIAQRQGFKGVRWMKMTDPSAIEAPSKVGSFLIWQQPHIIYMAELLFRHQKDSSVLADYSDLVFKTAEFMADFADYDGMGDRYILQGAIPAQETLRASETVNSPFELSYWHYALSVAQQWRLRLGLPKNMEWEIVLDKLSPLAHKDGLYLAAETALDTYIDTRYTSDHMAVLGALGMMPKSRLVREDIMTNTFNWIWDNWNWGKTWGWDYPMTAMCAARIGLPEKAVDALLMDRRTNTYLVNGHNYQDGRLRVYLPGNGGLLTAVAMMCAGWDGSEGKNPGFPNNGQWKVKWEGLDVMP
ncbi:MAG: hypothetical protein KBG19_05135 [Bacteroidales bacterium]|nr:hypothetical protein [Bacteroidales bacterium]OQC04664.1 MAG: hypothetical protein BWX77_00048 [Bacteroidetes bacterium ADurb.Bin090]HOD27054.1 hypothetical protein [Bacteroidales bacterium]HOF92979.1 hypothetical protein [Bacteroidales bacterium]